MKRGRRGAALVELALTLPLLLLILMGIAECGMYLHGRVMLAHGVSEGARKAAIGRPLREVIETTMTPLPRNSTATVRAEFQTTSPGPWAPLTDTADGMANAAPHKAEIRVTIQGYRYRMVTGSFFSWLPGYDRGTIPMSDDMVVMRD
jgi:Flp pilus assembly protein TadG